MLPKPYQHLDPAWVRYQRTSWLATGLVPVTAAAALAWTEQLPWSVPAGLALLLFALAWHLPQRHWHHYGWHLDELGLWIRRGLLFRQEIFIPVDRLQHIELLQGPLMRAFGLAGLALFTAGSQWSRVWLPGLQEERARTLRDELNTRIGRRLQANEHGD